MSYHQEAVFYNNCWSSCLCLLGSNVYAAVGQCHFLVDRTRDQRNDNRSGDTRCDFTSEVPAGNENAIHVGTTGIFSCEFSERDGLLHWLTFYDMHYLSLCKSMGLVMHMCE